MGSLETIAFCLFIYLLFFCAGWLCWMSNFWSFWHLTYFYTPTRFKIWSRFSFSCFGFCHSWDFSGHTQAYFLVLARGKQPRLINYIHKYLVYFDVLSVLKERKENQDWVKTSFTQRKMKSFLLLFEDLKAVTKKPPKKWTSEIFRGILFCSQRNSKENISRFQYNLGLSVPQWQGEEIVVFKSRWIMDKKKLWSWKQSVI